MAAERDPGAGFPGYTAAEIVADGSGMDIEKHIGAGVLRLSF
jgi:hypothetical protein